MTIESTLHDPSPTPSHAFPAVVDGDQPQASTDAIVAGLKTLESRALGNLEELLALKSQVAALVRDAVAERRLSGSRPAA